VRESTLSLLWVGLGRQPDAWPRQSHPVICHVSDVQSVCLDVWDSAPGCELNRHWSRAIGVDDEVAGAMLRWKGFGT